MSALDIVLHPKQTAAYESTATEILYGGAAGGGKSFFMRVAAILWCSMIPGLQVYLFRRTYDDLIKNHIEGSAGFRVMLAAWEAKGWAKIVETEIRFWNGSKIYLCHCEHEKHRFKYQGAEIHVLLIDELTLFTEVIYRFLRTRVRMTSITPPPQFAGAFPRILCGSNPGNIGHAWVKTTFLMDGDEKVKPMAIRQMPDEEGGMRRQYIPATLDDNPTMDEFDPNYRKRIRGMGNAALVKAFEKGDWDAVVGSFLEGVWDEDRHVVEPFTIPSTWKVWRAMDWGYAKPYSVHWYAMDPDGCVYIWRELYGWGGKADVGSREEASAVAKKIADIEKHDERMGYEYRQNPADSAIFAQIGAQRSIAQLFRQAGVRWVECAKGPRSRVIGAQLIVEMLRTDKLKVFKTCKHWIRTVPALMPDENNPEDINTKMEDHCFTPDTQVLTNRGLQRIDSLSDELVMNDLGEWVPFTITRRTRKNADVVRVTFADGSSVVCTPDHRFLVGNDKYAEARDLADTICYAINVTERIPCKSLSLATRSRSSTAHAITSAVSTFSARAFDCIAWFGKPFMESQFLKVITSTIKTRIAATTSPIIWNCWKAACTSRITARITSHPPKQLQKPLKHPRLGTQAKPARNGIGSTIERSLASCTKNQPTYATTAENGSSQSRIPNSVATHADLHGVALLGSTTSNERVSSAVAHSQSTSMQIPSHARASAAQPLLSKRVVSVTPVGKCDVWCIDVPGRHNFALANGVIVHNCWDDTRYALGPIRRAPDAEQKSEDDTNGMYKDANDNHILSV